MAVLLTFVPCQKPLNNITISLSRTEYEIKAGETLSIPFSLGELTEDQVTATVECINETFTAEVSLGTPDQSKGTITVTAPEYLYNDATFTVTLTINDRINTRVSSSNIQVSAKPNVEVLLQAANTFIVKPSSIFSFNAAKGSTASGVDFDSVGLLWQDKVGLVSKVFEHEGKIVAHLGEGEGNAVVYAKQGDKIVWSWTLWVISEEPKDITVGGFTFMDRNIGALNLTPGSEFSCGNMYQWGRKDAFAGANANNDIKKMYDINGQEVVRTEGLVEIADNIENATANPLIHYHQNYPSYKGNYSWITLDVATVDKEKVAALWGKDGAKTEADPCPTGYRVASLEAWAAVAALTLEPIFDSSYSPAEDVQSKWNEKYKAQYLKQSQFRGAKFGELTVLGSGEYAHAMTFSQGFGGSSNNIVSTVWTNSADPDMVTKGTNTYFRAISAKISYSYSSDKVTLNTANKIAFSYEQPVRCIKEQ